MTTPIQKRFLSLTIALAIVAGFIAVRNSRLAQTRSRPMCVHTLAPPLSLQTEPLDTTNSRLLDTVYSADFTTSGQARSHVITRLAFLSNHELLVGFARNQHYVWDLETGEMRYLEELSAEDGGAPTYGLNASRSIVVTEPNNESIEFWSTDDFSLLDTLQAPLDAQSLNFSPNDMYFVASDIYQKSVLWNLETKQALKQLEVSVATFSNDSQYIVAADRVGSIHLIRSADGTTLHSIPAHDPKSFVTTLITHPTADLFASGAHDRTIQLFSIEDEQLTHVHTFDEPNSWIEDLTFSKDGSLLISASNTIRFWNVKRLRERATLGSNNYCSRTTALALSPNGYYLAIGNENSSVFILAVQQ